MLDVRNRYTILIENLLRKKGRRGIIAVDGLLEDHWSQIMYQKYKLKSDKPKFSEVKCPQSLHVGLIYPASSVSAFILIRVIMITIALSQTGTLQL